MLLRATPSGLIVRDEQTDRWVSLPAANAYLPTGDALLETETRDMLAFLAGGSETREAAAAALEAARGDAAVTGDPTAAGLPFRPRSLRAAMLFESHAVQSARMLVKHFFPTPVARVMETYERVARGTFPPLRPKKAFYERPEMYVANHTTVLADGEPMWWPSHTRALDFELELAFVLARPLADASPAEAAAAVGGWMVLNDWSARDVQADDARRSIFGPVVKAKTFANSLGCDVLTADEVPDWQRMSGRVRVDGELWCEGTTAGAQHDVGAMLAFTSAGERLAAGDVLSTGTMPGCCGLELERWLRPGQTVELEIDRIGTLTDRPRRRAEVTAVRVAKPFSLLAALGTAAHHGFETQAGVGLVFEPFLGRRRTAAMWLVALPFWMWRATRPAPRDEPLLALNAGVAIAGSFVHFVEWPWSLRGGVLPWLDAAEGLPASKLPAYNTILWLWMVGGVGSALLETRRSDRKWVALGIATAPGLLASARHHFRWAREQAELEPERWSPELLREQPTSRRAS